MGTASSAGRALRRLQEEVPPAIVHVALGRGMHHERFAEHGVPQLLESHTYVPRHSGALRSLQ